MGVCVLGGLNIDLHIRASSGAMLPRTSNPGRAVISAGGVARNVAECLARWGVATSLLGAIGRDPLSDHVLASTRAAGVDVDGVLRLPDQTCGLYAALLDADGDLAMAASSMGASESMDPACVDSWTEAIASASVFVVDANTPPGVLERALAVAGANGVPVVADPVSVAKARRLGECDCSVLVVTPNAAEAEVLLDPASRLRADWVVVTLGERGVDLYRAGTKRTGTEEHLPGRRVTPVDVTGAGDALVAGLAFAIDAGAGVRAGVRLGMEMARETVIRESSVPEDLDRGFVERALTRIRTEEA